MSVPNRRLVFVADARLDLRDIQRYTARQWGTRQGRLYRVKLTDAIGKLTRFPFLGTVPPNLAPGLRAHPVEQHIIYYRVSDEAVTIIRILHAKMDIPAQLGP